MHYSEVADDDLDLSSSVGQRTSNLTVVKADLEHGGEYVCVGKNSAGTRMRVRFGGKRNLSSQVSRLVYYRLVQLDFSPEIEVLYILVDRCHCKERERERERSLKHHT